MARDLNLKVNLQALDNASRTFRNIAGGARTLGREFNASRDQLKALNEQQRDITAFRTANIEITKQARAMRDLQTKLRGHTEALEKQRTAHVNLKGNLKAAQTQYNKLSKALIDGKGNSAEFHRELEKAQIKLQSSQQAFTRSAANIKRYQDRIRGADTQLEQLRKQHETSQTSLGSLRTKLEQTGISTDGLGKKARSLRTEQERLNSVLEQQKARLAEVTRQQKRLGQAKAEYERMSATAGSMATAGAGGLATGGGILYAGAQMMAPGLDFDASMSKVQALTRLDGGSEEMAALREQARQLGASTQFTAGQAADAQGYLAMAGFNSQAIQAAMPGMLDLAKAGDSGLAETADIASNILTGFNLAASETGRLGDVLVGTFTRSNTNLQMLGETMKYAAPVAASVGQDIETVAAMAGKLGDAGIQGSMGGTALRAILNRLSAPPAAAAKALDKLGISAKDAQGNLRDMPTVLQEIYEKTKNMGDADRAGLLKAIAGEEAVAGMQVLVAQAGSGALQEFVSTLKATEGEASATSRTMADNLRGDLSAMGSAWEDLGIQLQEQQNGPMREITQALTGIIGGVKGWIAENPKLAANIVKTAAGVGILMAGMGGLTLAIASILGPFAMVRYGMMLFGIQGGGLATTLVSLGKTALPMVATGLRLVAAAAMANPVTALIGGLALGAALIWANWEALGPKFRSWFGAIGGWLGAMPAQFKQLGSDMIAGLVGGITSGLGAMKDAVTGVGSKAIGWFKDKLGIHSPSRVFAGLGGDTMAGLEQGLQAGEGGPLKQVAGAAKRLTAAGAIGLSAAVVAMPAAAGEAVAFDTRPPLAAARSAAPQAAASNAYTITINAAPGQDANAIARAVAAELDRRERDKGARGRSALFDQE